MAGEQIARDDGKQQLKVTDLGKLRNVVEIAAIHHAAVCCSVAGQECRFDVAQLDKIPGGPQTHAELGDGVGKDDGV